MVMGGKREGAREEALSALLSQRFCSDHELTGEAKASSGNKVKISSDPLTSVSYQGRWETTCGETGKITYQENLICS